MQTHAFIQQILILTYYMLRHCPRLWEQMTMLINPRLWSPTAFCGCWPRKADVNPGGVSAGRLGRPPNSVLCLHSPPLPSSHVASAEQSTLQSFLASRSKEFYRTHPEWKGFQERPNHGSVLQEVTPAGGPYRALAPALHTPTLGLPPKWWLTAFFCPGAL